MSIIKKNGVKIHFEVHGQGHPVVLLHGFTSSSQLWKLLGYVSSLQQAFQVILIDQRGHGISDKPKDKDAYRLPYRMDDVIHVVDHLGGEIVPR